MPILHEKTSTIILAAGVGKRMKSSTPKILQRVLGKPLISFVTDLAFGIGSKQVILVVSQIHDDLSTILGKEISYAIQKEPLGSGDAAKTGMKSVEHENVLILCGDVPLLKKQTILDLVEHHTRLKAETTLLTCELSNPHGYGRIIRDPDGYVAQIVEECDATAEQRQIKEINAGVYYGKTALFSKALDGITTNNKQGEYYLTDAIRNIASAGSRVAGYMIANANEVVGVNTQRQLAQVRAILKNEWYTQLMQRGIHIEDPTTTDIDLSVKIGDGVQIRPHTLIEGNTEIGDGETVGPFVWIKDGKKINIQ
jgi:bifunctional UDP-N-acetylglucosamine pyrophosphorylase/glucosamine-1-phosphate N-acetyltransferase